MKTKVTFGNRGRHLPWRWKTGKLDGGNWVFEKWPSGQGLSRYNMLCIYKRTLSLALTNAINCSIAIDYSAMSAILLTDLKVQEENVRAWDSSACNIIDEIFPSVANSPMWFWRRCSRQLFKHATVVSLTPLIWVLRLSIRDRRTQFKCKCPIKFNSEFCKDPNGIRDRAGLEVGLVTLT